MGRQYSCTGHEMLCCLDCEFSFELSGGQNKNGHLVIVHGKKNTHLSLGETEYSIGMLSNAVDVLTYLTM